MSDQMQTPPEGPTPPAYTEQERQMGLIAHILGLIGIIGPLIFWLIKKEESAFVKEQALESLNFQLTVLLGYVASMILMIVKVGFLLGNLVWIANVIFVIIATVEASKGVLYKYPVNLRLIK